MKGMVKSAALETFECVAGWVPPDFMNSNIPKCHSHKNIKNHDIFTNHVESVITWIPFSLLLLFQCLFDLYQMLEKTFSTLNPTHIVALEGWDRIIIIRQTAGIFTWSSTKVIAVVWSLKQTAGYDSKHIFSGLNDQYNETWSKQTNAQSHKKGKVCPQA